MIPPFRREFDAAQMPNDALIALGPATGSWIPTLTFATPGDLSVVYSVRTGFYRRVGTLVELWFAVATSTFTHTTATGNLKITGIPFLPISTHNKRGTCSWGGITKANYTQVVPTLSSTSEIFFVASGSGQAISNIAVADTPTASTMNLQGHITYY